MLIKLSESLVRGAKLCIFSELMRDLPTPHAYLECCCSVLDIDAVHFRIKCISKIFEDTYLSIMLDKIVLKTFN